MKRKIGRGIATILALLGLTACGGGTGQQGTGEGGSLSGSITIDGSSTVAPITEAMAEEFQKQQKQVQIAIGVSGTGGGFKKFCGGNGYFQCLSSHQTRGDAEVSGKRYRICGTARSL